MIESSRLGEALRHIKKKIQGNPKVLARFDKDGNGMIDGDEWEEVRQLVIARLERQDLEAQEAKRAAEAAGSQSLPHTVLGGMAAGLSSSEMASEIVNSDLAGREGLGDEMQEMSSAFVSARQIILEQEGGIGKKIFEGIARREYTIKNSRGQILGNVNQVELEWLENFKNRSFFSIPDLNFNVRLISGEGFTLRRSQAIAKDRIDVLSGSGTPIASVRWQFSLILRSYELFSTTSSDKFIMKQPLLKPLTMMLYDELENEVGKIEKGWNGLGAFLTGANRMRIVLKNPKAFDLNFRWALIAACLLEDLNAEKKQKRLI